MQLEVASLLEDILRSAARISAFIGDCDAQSYAADELRRSAVERQFEIIGEALNRLSRAAPERVEKIDNHQRIISFRNVLIHGYDAIDDDVVWDVITEYLPILNQQVAALMDEQPGA